MACTPPADEHLTDQAKQLSELAHYSTLEAGAITPGLIVTRNITDIEEAYKLFEEVRSHSMAHLWERMNKLTEPSAPPAP